jgi:hypothetical protein
VLFLSSHHAGAETARGRRGAVDAAWGSASSSWKQALFEKLPWIRNWKSTPWPTATRPARSGSTPVPARGRRLHRQGTVRSPNSRRCRRGCSRRTNPRGEPGWRAESPPRGHRAPAGGARRQAVFPSTPARALPGSRATTAPRQPWGAQNRVSEIKSESWRTLGADCYRMIGHEPSEVSGKVRRWAEEVVRTSGGVAGSGEGRRALGHWTFPFSSGRPPLSGPPRKMGQSQPPS